MKTMNHSYAAMFWIMLLSGLLTTMNVWVDKYQDIRWSINDLYMTLLMTGWMFLFMGIYNQETNIIMIGVLLVVVNFICIRTQFMVTEQQYLKGMIPHHSMAIHMSQQLLKKKNNIPHFLENIIHTQEKEIQFMKMRENLLKR
jgi:hypothetical protein